MNEELRPCPFCGSKANTDLSDFGSAMVFCSAEESGVDCPVNPETGFHDSRESAIAAWNHRPVEDALRDKFDSMVRVNDANLACYNNCAKENAMLKAQVKRLEDSRFALAVAHTEDVLTIERLTRRSQGE